MLTESHATGKVENPAGTILREAREARGLTLDDAAGVTRISKTYLNALEEGMFDRLPSAVYVKGFLRIYAAYLNISESRIIQVYETSTAEQPQNPDKQELRSTPTRTHIITRLAGKRLYLVLSFIAILSVASYFLTTTFREMNDENTGSAAFHAGDKIEVPVPSPAQSSAIGAVIQDPASTGEKAAEQTEKPLGDLPPVSRGLALKIKVIEDGWLDITIDDTISQHYELKSGDLIEWKGEKGFTLDIGNAGGIEVELNGKVLRPFGQSGETVHVKLKEEDGDH